jgi:spermidine/putrescine-binding protein
MLVLAACPAEPDEVAVACEEDETDGDLSLFNWPDYIGDDLLEAFAVEHGVSVEQDYFASNEELLARIQAGGAGYDVIVPSDYVVEIMVELDLLLPLDHGAIPNLDNVSDTFRDPPFDPGNEHSAPYQWGTTGIGVNVERLEAILGEDVPRSWSLVFDPELASQYSGEISLLDDARETMGAALKYLGHSLNTTDEDEIREAARLITETREHVATFASLGYADMIATGETLVSHGWSGDLLIAVDESVAGELEYVIPAEGSVMWVDNMAVPADAPSPCTGHTFINFILEAENGAALTNFTSYASPNAAAVPHIQPEILDDPRIFPPDDVKASLELIESIGEAAALYEELFAEASS